MAFWNAVLATPYPGLNENIKVLGWTAQYQQRIQLGAVGVVPANIIDAGLEAGGNPPE